MKTANWVCYNINTELMQMTSNGPINNFERAEILLQTRREL